MELKQQGLGTAAGGFRATSSLLACQVTLRRPWRRRPLAAGPPALPGVQRHDVLPRRPTAEFAWTIRVVAAGTGTETAGDPVFANNCVRPGGQTGRPGGRNARAGPRPGQEPASDAAAVLKELDGFTVLARRAATWASTIFLAFIRNAETGVKERGMFEGRGPLAILLLVLSAASR